jgi:hypothetical protein
MSVVPLHTIPVIDTPSIDERINEIAGMHIDRHTLHYVRDLMAEIDDTIYRTGTLTWADELRLTKLAEYRRGILMVITGKKVPG